MATSQNGWSANDRSQIQTYTIGKGRKIALRKGDAGYLLKHFADWFDAKIEDIEQGELDDWGYAERAIRGGTQTSNHASGTAMDLNSLRHGLGKRGTFSAAKTSAIRQRLKLYDGALRWGGDYENRPDEMHVEINAGPAKVREVAAKIRALDRASRASAKPSVPIEVTRIRKAINERLPLPLKDLDTLIKRGTKPYAAAAKALRNAMQPAMKTWLKAADPKTVTPPAPKLIEVTRIRNAINDRRPLPLGDLDKLAKLGVKPYSAAAKALRDATRPAMKLWLNQTDGKPAAKKTTTKKTASKSTTSTSRTVAKKAPAKKTAAKRAPTKKTTAKKTTAKKTTAKKTTAKKAAKKTT